MYGIADLFFQNRRDQTLTFDTRFSGKSRCHDGNAEMGLNPRSVAGMPSVKMRLVHNFQPLRLERRFQLASYGLRDGHETLSYAIR